MDDKTTEFLLLNDVLRKKRETLETILAISENQEVLLNSPPTAERAAIFKEMSAEKQKGIDEVIRCDGVFETMFEPLKPYLDQKTPYRDILVKTQALVDDVLTLDAQIRAQEAKNRELLSDQIPAFQKKNATVTDHAKRALISRYKENSKP
ncbi:hypothetical protein FACS189490_10070 [Clostridia bacterium]|nr:hypothetical protein FACS189490_10070 [Clostridia bacterium]